MSSLIPLYCSCWEQKESLWGTVCQGNLRAFQWLHTSKVRSRVRWMDVWSLAGFQVHKGMHSASPHYQGKTQPNQNGDKTRKRNKKWLKLSSRGDHIPILVFSHTKAEIRFQKLSYAIVMLIARQCSDSFIIVFHAFVLHIITEFHTICITHSVTCNLVVYITVIHRYLWQCAIHSLSAFDCMVSWEADCEPAPAFLIQRQLMHLQFWTWWFG